jgi:rare lipoprotein A (peptidoglycan hydrolase)
MKRITATLLLIFISSLILSNLLIFINFNKENNIKINTISVRVEEKDSTILEVPKKDTILKPSKPLTTHNDKKYHLATWYNTKPHPKVYREHPTAAYNLVPKGTWLLVKNLNTGDSCMVEVTDRHKMGKNHIDLSYMAFGILAKHSSGKIKVIVKEL